MIIFYRFLFPLIALLAGPYFLLLHAPQGGYAYRIWYRFGLYPSLPPPKNQCKRIWIQAVSVGELSSLGKLLQQLKQDDRVEIVLTGTTSTGLRMAAEKFSDQLLAHGPFPLDWWLFSSLAWTRIKPDLIITVDSELWPEHFHQASIRGVPALVLNARLSDRTFGRLLRSSLARTYLLPKGLEVLTTSERQRDRWLQLGVPNNLVQAVGNLKIDAATAPEKDTRCPIELKEEFGFPPDCLVIAGLSTWPGEEELLVETTKELRNRGHDVRLLIIPRHAERGSKLDTWLEKEELPHHRRSQSHQAPEGTIIYLADTTGELTQLIPVVNLAFGGKTLPPNTGGQNPIEPVSLGIPLVLGPNFQNFRETCNSMLVDDAIRTVKDAAQLTQTLISLIEDENDRSQLSKNAINWMNAQGSPTDRTLSKIFEILQLDCN